MTKKNTAITASALIITLIVAAIATLIYTTEQQVKEPVIEIITKSDFAGIDGSISEFALDTLANGYKAWLQEENPEETTQKPPAATKKSYKQFKQETAEKYPQTDAFNQDIQFRPFKKNQYQLFSAGKDELINTKDDYIKTYVTPTRDL